MIYGEQECHRKRNYFCFIFDVFINVCIPLVYVYINYMDCAGDEEREKGVR